MRAVLLLLAMFLLCGVPSRAAEADASGPRAARSFSHSLAGEREDRSIDTGDWVAAAGIACYGIVPAVVLVAVLFLGSAFVRNVYSLPVAAWIAPPRLRPRDLSPPRGFILLRF